eukprot:1367171-Pleurochrysis_carterae.AAC.1
MYGWTMPYKWGHSVATLPVTNGTVRHTRRMTELLRINWYFEPILFPSFRLSTQQLIVGAGLDPLRL